MDFTGTGNTLNLRAPERVAADHGLAALLGHRMPRRRLPLRPGQRAGPRAVRRRPAVGVLRRDPPGPGALAGEADRRALGRGPGRLPGRQLPGAVVGVERHLPRCGARLLAGQGRAVAELASRLTGSSDLYESDGRKPFAVDQLRHRPRRLHAGRPRLVQRASTTRPTSRTTATAPTTTARGTAASRVRPTTPPIVELRGRQQRNFLATLLLSQGVPMLLGGDELGRTQCGNNNAWCQDNEISWFDWDLDDESRRSARVHPAADRASPAAPGVPPPPFPPVAPPASSGLPDAWWFRPDGRKMTRDDWDRHDNHVVGLFLNGRDFAERARSRRAHQR